MSFFREYNVPGWGEVCEFDAYDMHNILADKPRDMWDEEQVYDQLQMNYTDTVNLFTKGWPKGADIIRDMADRFRPMMPQPKDLRRMLAYRDIGDELVVDRMYSGQLDRMWRTRKRRYAPTQTTITIASHYCTVSLHPESCILSGSIAIALAYLLEQYGFRVEVFGILTINPQGDVYRYQRNKNTQVAIAHLKSPHQSLQLDYVAAALHPAPTYLLAKRMLTEATYQSPFRGRSHDLRCCDAATKFCTDWVGQGGRRVDFASDYVGSFNGAQSEMQQVIKTLGPLVFEEG